MSLLNLFQPNNYHLYLNDPTFSGDLLPELDNIYDIGSILLRWKNIYTNGLFLQTTGGTPSSLNYYEVYTHVTTFVGPYAAGISNNFVINRVGNICSARIPALTGASTVPSIISINTVLPSRFRPVSVVTGSFTAQDNSVAVQGIYQISNTGDVFFGVGTTIPGNYAGAGAAGILIAIVLTWTIN